MRVREEKKRESRCASGGCVGMCLHAWCVCLCARARVCGGENNHCNPAILFNEEWKAGIHRRGYVPHINVCSVDILPLFK